MRFLLSLFCLLPWALCAEVLPYPVAPGLERSPDARLTVDGRDIAVRATPSFSFASFAFRGEVEVAVRVSRPILKAVIRPLSLGIVPEVKDGVIRFRLKGPVKLALEVDGDLRRPLFVFADPPETGRPSKSAKNVRYFEGGKVYNAGKIQLKDGQTLYLEGGAVVRGSVSALKAKGIRILGPGMLDASTREEESKTIDLRQCRDVELGGFTILGSRGWSITTRLCEDVRAHDLKVLGWRENDDGFDPDSCRKVRLERCFFRTKDDCIAVKAHGSFGLRPAGEEGTSDAYSTDDVVVTDSTFWSSEWGHALTVGFAVSGPAIRNVTFRNCDIIKKEKGPAMSVDNHDLGLVEKVVFEDIRVEPGCDRLTAVKVAFSEYSADCPVRFFRNNPKREKAAGPDWEQIVAAKKLAPRGQVRQVIFRNIQVTGGRLPSSSIVGPETPSIRDITYENITLDGTVLRTSEELGLRASHADSVTVK